MSCRLWLFVALLSVASSSRAQEAAAEPEVEPAEAQAEEALADEELPVVYAVPAQPPQAQPPRVEQVEQAEPEALQVDADAPQVDPEVPSAPTEAPRLVLATTLGGLAGVVGGFGLAWGPAFILAGTADGSEEASVAAFVMGATTWGTPLTTAVGIFAAGRAAGGRGNFGVTLLGTTLGGVLGAGLAGIAYAAEHSQALTVTAVLSIPVFQWAAGVLAYHLSHRALRSRSRPSDDARLQALPSVSVHPGGASLAWRGSF